MAEIYINGKFYPEEEAKVSVFDHGFLFGDGIFEGIKAYNDYVFKLEEHLDRFYRSGKAINLNMPCPPEEMKEKVLNSLRHNDLHDAYIRLIVTRGRGGLGIDPRSCPQPSTIIISKEWESHFSSGDQDEGMNLLTTTIRNQPIQGLPPTSKTLNYLTNIMARIQALQWEADEALLLDMEGKLSEGSVDNIFVFRKGRVYTPPSINNLPGITRGIFLDLLKESDYEVKEANLGLAEVYTADEIFLSGTAVEIQPVIEVDGRRINNGKPGELYRKLKRKFKTLTGKPETGTPIYQ